MKINLVYVMLFLGFLVSFLVYPKLPAEIAMHWNAKGVADGFENKGFGLFFLPIVTTVMYIFMKLIPKIDPLKKNFKSYAKYYHEFVAQMVSFMLYIHVITIAWNMGYPINVSLLMIPGLAVLFWQIANLLEHSKRSWFIGFRTPWTLSSNKVWKKTNKLAATVFRWIAVFTLSFMLFPEHIMWFVISMIFVIVYLISYSYKEYSLKKN